MLFDEGQIDSLFGLTNERFMFEGLDHRFKVCILSFAKGGKTTRFPAAFRIQPREAVWPEALDDFFHNPEEHLFLPVEVIRKLSPDSLSVLEFKCEEDIRIASRVARFPLLGASEANWSVQFHREFDMTNDSDLFKTAGGKNRLPLYEGKMIHQFNHQFASPKYWIDECEARERLLGSEIDQKQRLDYESYRLGFRDVASNSNERTCIMTMLPANVFCNHKLPTALVRRNREEIDARCSLFFCGCMNSFLVDFLVRQRVTANLTFITLYQLPMPRVGESEHSFESIAKCAARLICTTPEFDDLAKAVGLKSHKQGVTDPIERAALRAELDAMVAHLYRLTEEEFAHVLSTFPLVKDEVKQAALDEFIRMRESGEAAVFNPDLAKPAAAVVDPAKAVKDLIAAGESATVEFKSSARWDVKNSKAEKFIERIIIKTVAALLNTQGGTLVIGVENDGNIYGLAEDYKLSGAKGRDSFENWLTQTLMKDFGKDVAALLSVAFHELAPPETNKPGSGDVCVVSVKPSPKPRFLVEEGQERFYIRTGNATNALKMSDFLDYCKERWPEGAATATV